MHVERDQSRLPRTALRAAAASPELRCQADPRPYHAVRRLTRGGNLLGRRHVRARLSQRRLEGGVPDRRVGSMLAAAYGGAGPRQASLLTGSTEPEQTTPGRQRRFQKARKWGDDLQSAGSKRDAKQTF